MDGSYVLTSERTKNYWFKCYKNHSKGYYKPYKVQAQSEVENKKRKENRTENNEAERSVLVEQDRRSKRQKSNDNRSNESIICGNNIFRKDSKLYRLCETERAELFLSATKFYGFGFHRRINLW